MIDIEIDTREPIALKLKALEVGDYQFRVNNKLIRIERKTMPDLIQSFRSNRLAIQLNQLKADCDYPFLAVIGHPGRYDFIDRSELRNMLLSVKLSQILVERFDNDGDYLARLPELVEYFRNTEIQG